jgi:hypothetical protein
LLPPSLSQCNISLSSLGGTFVFFLSHNHCPLYPTPRYQKPLLFYYSNLVSGRKLQNKNYINHKKIVILPFVLVLLKKN